MGGEIRCSLSLWTGLPIPADRVAGCQSVASSLRGVGKINLFDDGSSAVILFAVLSECVPPPFRRRCLAGSLRREVFAQLSLSGGHSVVWAKKKPVHRQTNPSGSFLLAGGSRMVVYVPANHRIQ